MAQCLLTRMLLPRRLLLLILLLLLLLLCVIPNPHPHIQVDKEVHAADHLKANPHHVLPVAYDFTEGGGVLFATPAADGTLRDEMYGGLLRGDKAINLAIDLLMALQRLHKQVRGPGSPFGE